MVDNCYIIKIYVSPSYNGETMEFESVYTGMINGNNIIFGDNDKPTKEIAKEFINHYKLSRDEKNYYYYNNIKEEVYKREIPISEVKNDFNDYPPKWVLYDSVVRKLKIKNLDQI